MRLALREVASQHDLAAMGAARGPLDPGAQNAAFPHVDLRHALWKSPAGVGWRTGAKQQVSRARFLPYHDFGNMSMPVNAHVWQRVARRERARAREREAHIPRIMCDKKAHTVDDGPGETAHRRTVLVEIVVAEHCRHRCERLQIANNLGAADVARMDDMLAIGERIKRFNRQNAMRIRDYPDPSQSTPRFLSPLTPQSILAW